MSADTIAIISTGVALAVLIIGLFAWLRADIREHTGRLDGRITQLDGRITRLDERITRLEVELRERMAKLEGLLEGLREAVTGKRAA